MSAGPFDQTTPATPTGALHDDNASTKDVAKDEAASVASDAKAGTQHVAETAKGEAQHVAQEAQQQIKDLYRQVMSEITSQGSDQKSRASGGLRTLADDLGGMATHSDSGIGGDLARQAADRTRTVADWLETREPADVVDEVKRYARRKPGAFLAGAAVLGLVAGRLTRGVVAEKQAENDADARLGAHGVDAAGQPLVAPQGIPTAPAVPVPAAGTTYVPGTQDYADDQIGRSDLPGGELNR